MNAILSSVLIAYFSATGTTANVAQKLATALDAPVYEIRPAQPYTDADLNWHDESSRSSLEMDGKIPYPELADLGIVASTDPVANDQAFVDMIYASTDPGAKKLQERIDRQMGRHILPYAESIGLGTTKYELIEL